MIKKVAEESVLRMCAPEDLSGVYGDDEMDQAANPDNEITKETAKITKGEDESKKIEGKKEEVEEAKVIKAAEKQIHTQKVIEDSLKKITTIDGLKSLWIECTLKQQENDKIKGWFAIRKTQIKNEMNAQTEFEGDMFPDVVKIIKHINSIDNKPHLENWYKKHLADIQKLEPRDYKLVTETLESSNNKLRELAENQGQEERDIAAAKNESKNAKAVAADSRLAIQRLLNRVFEKKILLKG